MPPKRAVNGASPGTGIPGGMNVGNQLTRNTGLVPAGQARKASTPRPSSKPGVGAFRHNNQWYWRNQQGNVAQVPWSVATPEWQQRVNVIATPHGFSAPTSPARPTASPPSGPATHKQEVVQEQISPSVNPWGAATMQDAYNTLTGAMQQLAPLKAKYDAIAKGFDTGTSVWHTRQNMLSRDRREGGQSANQARQMSGFGDWGRFTSGAFNEDERNLNDQLVAGQKANEDEWGQSALLRIKNEMSPIVLAALMQLMQTAQQSTQSVAPDVQAIINQLNQVK